jgi:hypothetical protein
MISAVIDVLILQNDLPGEAGLPAENVGIIPEIYRNGIAQAREIFANFIKTLYSI